MTDIKEKAALTSVFASGGLAIAKFVAAIMSGSLGLLSDALHSLLDLGATILTYIAVRIGGLSIIDGGEEIQIRFHLMGG